MIAFWLTGDPWHLIGVICGLSASGVSILMIAEAVKYRDSESNVIALGVFLSGIFTILTGWYLPAIAASGIIMFFIATAVRTLWSGVKLLLGI